nr:retrotransposon protein, putative, Ty1-copia subclass [Tanacetum cinerariifolium]
KQEHGNSVGSYVIKMKGYVEQLNVLVMCSHKILVLDEKGLPKNVATPQVMVIQGGRIQKSNKKSQNAKGKGKGKGKENDNPVYIPKPKNPKPSIKEHPTKDETCHHCKEVGHWKRNCHVYLAELIKKKKQVRIASSLDIFTIELFAFPNKSWVYDTGFGTHTCNTKQCVKGERKLEQGALYLHVGNSVRAQLEAIRSYDLVLPNGLVICLDNFHFSKNNFLYFNAIPSDGIYEIDMLNLVLNVNSIYNDSYFITFIDDYSRYGYVYLLKHKHEVFETFKQLTPPYTPQHNGVSKRRNRTLLDIVRSMMNLTTMPLSFWDYALESSTRILNMVLTKKMQSIKDNQVWGLVDLPPNGKTVESKWIFKKKTDMDGNVHTYKARLVEKGFNQTYGVDYEETFSPNADIRAIRILIAIAAFYDYEILQMNVKTAFLNGYLDEDIYMFTKCKVISWKVFRHERFRESGLEAYVVLFKVKRMQNVLYALAIGSIMYAVRCTKPDVAFAQNITSHFQQNPGEPHWTIVKTILKYLRNTKDKFLVYSGNQKAKL